MRQVAREEETRNDNSEVVEKGGLLGVLDNVVATCRHGVGPVAVGAVFGKVGHGDVNTLVVGVGAVDAVVVALAAILTNMAVTVAAAGLHGGSKEEGAHQCDLQEEDDGEQAEEKEACAPNASCWLGCRHDEVKAEGIAGLIKFGVCKELKLACAF